jgi:pimeloyl-ACP methyl ester carboxylesterase
MPEAWGSANPYSGDFAQALTVDLMDALSMERAVLVGNSAGGALAVRLALAHPERVEALILVDAAIYSGGERQPWITAVLRTPQMRRVGPLLLRSVRDWGADFGRRAWHDPARIPPEVWTGYTLPLNAQDWDRALYEFMIAGGATDLGARVGELDLPVLVVTGDDDRIVPTEESQRLASEIPGADLVVISDCGHVPHEECPQAFMEAVQAFVATLP